MSCSELCSIFNDHFSNGYHFIDKPFIFILIYILKVMSKKKFIFYFGCRAYSYLQEMSKIFITIPSGTFSYVCRYRRNSSPYLRSQTKKLFLWKRLTYLINVKCKLMTSFPYQKVMKISHCSLLKAHCSKLKAHCSKLIAHCSKLIAHCSKLIAQSSLLIAHCSLLKAHCSLLKAHCSLLIAHC